MKHWVFDLDGTLVNSFPHYFDTLQSIFKKCNVAFTQELKVESLNKPAPKFLLEHLGAENVESAWHQLMVESRRDAAHIKPFQGIVETLDLLKKSGVDLAVWTSRELETAQLVLQHTELKQYFNMCISGTCVTQHKPHPEGLQAIADQLSADPRDITMVGDHDIDMLGGNALGARTVRAAWHGIFSIERCDHSAFKFDSVPAFHNWVKADLRIS